MIDHSELKKGVKIILDKEPYEILESRPMKKAQRRVIIQTRVKNLITGNVLDKNFHQGETFEEAEMLKFKAKFLYFHKDRYFFCRDDDSSKRFDLSAGQIGNQIKFLKSGELVEALVFDERIINISLPVKIQLKVIESPPGIKGDRAQGGSKIVTLETGAKIAAPLFIKEGDVVEVNIETGEYARRI